MAWGDLSMRFQVTEAQVTNAHTHTHTYGLRSSLVSFCLKAKNETQQENKKKYKKKASNKVVSGVSITSEIPGFLTHCSWNKIEQLYSGQQ